MKKIIVIIAIILMPLLAWGISPEEIESRKQFRLISKSVSLGNMKMLKGFVDIGIDADIASSSGKTLLMVACGDSNASIKIIKYLMDEGADIYAVSDSGHSALSIAMKKGNTEIINLLLNLGVDWRKADHSNIINIRDLNLIKYFIGDNIDVNIQDKYGITALMRTVINNDIDILKYLLNNGADVDLRDKNEKTALDHAVERDRKSMVLMLSD